MVVVPYLNLPALKVGRRTSPLDGLNLNRIFPGRPSGSASEMIADFVTNHLLPKVDVLIDLHSGGRSLLYTPLAATHVTGDADRDRRALDALEAFGAPIGLIARDIDSHGLLDYTAEAMGKIVISTELGGGGIVSPAAVQIGRRGVGYLLCHLGVIERTMGEPGRTRLMATPSLACFAFAPVSGLYEPVKELGERIEAGITVGLIHKLEWRHEPPAAVTAEVTGTLICRRAQGIVSSGDCVAIIAQKFRR